MSPREIVEELLELLFPPRCQVCGELADSPLCQTCLAEALFIESPRCLYCGVPIPESQAPHQLCADCRDGRWLSGMRAVGLHAGVLREAVIRYKFDGRTRLAQTLGWMLGDVIEAESDRGGLPLGACAGIVPVPLHPNRRRWRGFDQAELLCEPIAEQRRQEMLRAIRRVLPSISNEPDQDSVRLPIQNTGSGSPEEITFYRGRHDGEWVGVAFVVASQEGYGGEIEIMLGVNPQGTILGIEILDQRETPGLGAKIVQESFRRQFEGRSLADTQWAVRKDGGDIDQITGATVSTRAVVKAVQQGLKSFQQQRKRIFESH
jgi:electron transport complex protein RnfG